MERIYHFYKKASSVPYAMYTDEDKVIYPQSEEWNPEYIAEHGRILTPNGFEKNRCGTCYDTAWYINQELNEQNIQALLIFFQFKESTHLTNIVKVPNENRWVWVECSWSDFKGVHLLQNGRLAVLAIRELIQMLPENDRENLVKIENDIFMDNLFPKWRMFNSIKLSDFENKMLMEKC